MIISAGMNFVKQCNNFSIKLNFLRKIPTNKIKRSKQGERTQKKMGMSASQARLLSITARLNHVELETQYLSNAKIRLSDSTQKASDKYVAALNKTEYQYNYYNAAGEKITMDLSGAALTEYGELKNQYGLINAAGQILVSETDAANFQNSNTLEEFLEKYGVLGDLGEGDIIQVTNPEYETAWDKYEEEYAKWQTEKPDENDEKYYETVTSESELYKQFTEGTAGGCYTTVINPCSRGYMAVLHFCDVLEHMLDVGTHKTSDGIEFTIAASDSQYAGEPGGHWWEEGSQSSSINQAGGSPVIMEQLRDAIEGKYCCGEEHDADDETHYVNCPSDWGGCGSKHEIDCNEAEPCDGTMLVTDKIEDLYYDFSQRFYNGGDKLDLNNPDDADLYHRMIHLVEHDLKWALSEEKFDEEQYNNDLAAWKAKEPSEPTVAQYIDKEVRKIEDQDKAQWYVNLWHRMNGTSDFKAGFGNSEDYIAGDGWASKSETDQNWAVLKDGDMNSPEYLKYAIENGLITIEQVQFTDPSESGSGIENASWTSIVFSSAQDITEQKDQVAITLAETEYNQTLREIEAKDKEYDTQIKKLDTEHNALQTEYDSIKSVIEKNVERSFKIFS